MMTIWIRKRSRRLMIAGGFLLSIPMQFQRGAEGQAMDNSGTKDWSKAESWLVLSQPARRIESVLGIFPSEKLARKWMSDEGDMFEGQGSLRVVRDDPTLMVRSCPIAIEGPHSLVAREHWISRNRDRLGTLIEKKRQAIVFTWERVQQRDLLGARLGGRAVQATGAAWPSCVACKNPLSFVGVLDFRLATSLPDLPGTSLAYFHCFSCPSGTGATSWLKSAEQVFTPETPEHCTTFVERRGVSWSAGDLDWTPDLLERLSDTERSLLGDSPYVTATLFATKAGGYHSWLQPTKHPTCRCQRKMIFLGQFVGNGDIVFGDSGIVYVFYCSTGKCNEVRTILQIS